MTFGALCAGLWILGGPASQTSGETQVAKNWKALVDKQIILLVFSNGGMIHNYEHPIPPIPYVSHQWGNHNPILQKRHKKGPQMVPNMAKFPTKLLLGRSPMIYRLLLDEPSWGSESINNMRMGWVRNQKTNAVAGRRILAYQILRQTQSPNQTRMFRQKHAKQGNIYIYNIIYKVSRTTVQLCPKDSILYIYITYIYIYGLA